MDYYCRKSGLNVINYSHFFEPILWNTHLKKKLKIVLDLKETQILQIGVQCNPPHQ